MEHAQLRALPAMKAHLARDCVKLVLLVSMAQHAPAHAAVMPSIAMMVLLAQVLALPVRQENMASVVSQHVIAIFFEMKLVTKAHLVRALVLLLLQSIHMETFILPSLGRQMRPTAMAILQTF